MSLQLPNARITLSEPKPYVNSRVHEATHLRPEQANLV